MMSVVVTRFVRDEGTVVIFEGIHERMGTVTFAADHRPARALFEALVEGETPTAAIEGWQLLGRAM